MGVLTVVSSSLLRRSCASRPRPVVGAVRTGFWLDCEFMNHDVTMAVLDKGMKRAGVMAKLRQRSKGHQTGATIKRLKANKKAYHTSYQRIQNVLARVELDRTLSAERRHTMRDEEKRAKERARKGLEPEDKDRAFFEGSSPIRDHFREENLAFLEEMKRDYPTEQQAPSSSSGGNGGGPPMTRRINTTQPGASSSGASASSPMTRPFPKGGDDFDTSSSSSRSAPVTRPLPTLDDETTTTTTTRPLALSDDFKYTADSLTRPFPASTGDDDDFTTVDDDDAPGSSGSDPEVKPDN